MKHGTTSTAIDKAPKQTGGVLYPPSLVRAGHVLYLLSDRMDQATESQGWRGGR